MFSLNVSLENALPQEDWAELCDLLFKNHCLGIDEGELPVPEGLDSLASSNEFELALTPVDLDPPDIFKAYFEQKRDAEKSYRFIYPLLEKRPHSYAIEEIKDEDYTKNFRNQFQPILLEAGWVIKAPWHDISSDPSKTVVIEPGMAFGTGTHETTKSCVEFLVECANQYKPDNLLDFGCGSGILAIVAKKLKVPDVYGVDIDPLSIEATQNNAKLNLVECKAAINISDFKLTYPYFDGIVANILKNTILDFSHSFNSWIKPGGFLILSGLLEEQKTEIQNHFEALDFELKAEKIKEDLTSKEVLKNTDIFRWCTLLFEKHA